MRRLTAADVQVVINRPELGQVMAKVTSRGRVYVVDLNPLWADAWMCTCNPDYRPKDGSDCPHVRATKEAIR